MKYCWLLAIVGTAIFFYLTLGKYALFGFGLRVIFGYLKRT